jgi:hypothetical protein
MTDPAHNALRFATETFGVAFVAQLTGVDPRRIQRMIAGQVGTPPGVVTDFVDHLHRIGVNITNMLPPPPRGGV